MNDNTYINILISTLSIKNNLLDKIIQITLLQEANLSATPFSMAVFDETLAEKATIIEQLNKLDEGFEKVYDHVKEEISDNRMQYKDEILKLQELIKQVTEKSVKVQTEELRNKSKMELYFANSKKEIKNFKMSRQTVTSYYKNMPNQHQGQSYFLDKKK